MPAPDPRALVSAVAFLTSVPVRRRSATVGPGDMLAGATLFPLVGAALGAVVGATAAALALALPALLAATVAVALELALTGALHVDALADSADGLGGRDPGHALEIMRDHSLGAYGAAALALDLLAKAVAIAALAGDGAVLPIVAAFAVSRAAALPLAATLPYARPGDGAGRLLADRLGRPAALAGVALAAALAAAATGVEAVATLACLLLVTAAVGGLSRRRIGGVTGDVMGAATELTATLALIVAVAVAV
jgi:adenosylcobinamide-GDP ribazoletransferase